MAHYQQPPVQQHHFPLVPGAPSYPPQAPILPRSPSSTILPASHTLPPQRRTSTGPNWTTNALAERSTTQDHQRRTSLMSQTTPQLASTPVTHKQQELGRSASSEHIAASNSMHHINGLQQMAPSHVLSTSNQHHPAPHQPPHYPAAPHQSTPSHPQPPFPDAAYQAAQIEYHNQLVTYYYTYAHRGLLAPATGAQQEKARTVAVDWARKQGIVVNDVGASAGVPAGYPTMAQQLQMQPQVQTAPLPQTPFSPAPPQHQQQPGFANPSLPGPSRSAFVPSQISSTPTRSTPQFPSTGSARKQPLPTPPTTRLPSSPSTPSNLTRSASLATNPSIAHYSTNSSASSASDIGVGSRSESPLSSIVGANIIRTSSAQALSGLGRSGSISSGISTTASVGQGFPTSGKRPLPVPPTRSATLPPSTSTSDLSNATANLNLQETRKAKRPLPTPSGPPSTVRVPISSSQAPQQPFHIPPPPIARPRSPVVGVLDADRSRSPSPIPLFSVTSSEDDSHRSSSPVPGISIQVPETQPPPISTSTVTITPQSRSRPRLHPRHDPHHPSHYLYHPTSTSSTVALEAGRVVCAGCDQDMFGRALMAMGKQWHPDCFVCCADGCGVNLEHVQFDGKIREEDEEEEGGAKRGDVEVFCMVHYEELYAIQCFHCKTPIAESEYLTINDNSLTPQIGPRTYHALHFFCANCGDPFVDPKSLARGREGTIAKPYMAHKGHAYCFNCDVKLYQPKCAGCRKGMGGDVLEALGKQWHVGCFTCCTCEKILDNDFLVRDYGKNNGGEKAYCLVCYDIEAKSELDY